MFETQTVFYALELVSFTPEGYLSEEQARASIEQILTQERKLQLASERAEAALADLPQGASLQQLAAALGTEVQTAESFGRNDFVPGIGRHNSAIGAAFGLPVGTRSGLLTTSTDAFVIQVTERIPADSAAWAGQKEAQRIYVSQQMAQARLSEWLDALRANADIVDQRDEVLQAADDPQPMGGIFGVGD